MPNKKRLKQHATPIKATQSSSTIVSISASVYGRNGVNSAKQVSTKEPRKEPRRATIEKPFKKIFSRHNRFYSSSFIKPCGIFSEV